VSVQPLQRGCSCGEGRGVSCWTQTCVELETAAAAPHGRQLDSSAVLRFEGVADGDRSHRRNHEIHGGAAVDGGEAGRTQCPRDANQGWSASKAIGRTKLSKSNQRTHGSI
jgi:hypothetical protein